MSPCIFLSCHAHPQHPYHFFMGDIILLTKPVSLTEGDRVTLMTDVLMATDGPGKPEKLLYAVSLPPVPGQIEPINYPGCPIPCVASQMDWPRGFAACKAAVNGSGRSRQVRSPFLLFFCIHCHIPAFTHSVKSS